MDSIITLFMCGDVMTGRGIDQILLNPSTPEIHEDYVRDARVYVQLAENLNGKIQKPVTFPYIWGDALDELEKVSPDIRLINLETSITSSDTWWKGKGINYRMNPRNTGVLTAAKIDAVSLANNHVLDWGYEGLKETLQSLKAAGIRTVGAGEYSAEAIVPAIIEVPGKGRVVIFSFGSVTSGIPPGWAAGEHRGGVNLLQDLSGETVIRIGKIIRSLKQANDVIVASIHWGGNWGYDIPPQHRSFARALIDDAGVDVIHGHSSHHVQEIEVYHEKLILYGCGDFINDYEGISGHEQFRADLGLMYFAGIESSTGGLVQLRMVPVQMKRFQLNRASSDDARRLMNIIGSGGKKSGIRPVMNSDNSFFLKLD